jgi:hypothetical protein
MNYRHVYMLIIEHAKREVSLGLRPNGLYDYKKNFKNNYFEFHHILPRKLYPLWIKDKRNIVPLTAKEHYFCHELLYKIFPSRETFNALILITTDRKHKVTSAQYERARILNAKLMHDKMAGKKKNRLSVLKSAKTRTGTKRTKEQKERMKQAQIRYYASSASSNRRSGMLNKKQPDSFYEKRCKKVKCIETGMVFLSIGKAAEYINASNITGIFRSIKTGKTYKGLHYIYIC